MTSTLDFWWQTIHIRARSLMLHKLRSALTVLGMVFGVASVVFILSKPPTDQKVIDVPDLTPQHEPQETEYEAEMAGPGNMKAELDFDVIKQGSVTDYKFKVEIEGGPAGATYDISVADVVVVSVTLDEMGYVKEKWSTEKGNFPENFPEGVGKGTKVAIGKDISGAFLQN